MSPGLQHHEILFEGHVQGVGFRYTTDRIAQNYTVTGTVRNLSDGRGELMAQGPSDEVARFLEAVRTRFEGHIRQETASVKPATDLCSTFSIIR